MPKLTAKVPRFCRHQRGQAFVKINGQQIWLGRYGDPLTREKYDRLIGQWLANGRNLPPPAPTTQQQPLSILQVLAPYWRWAIARYTQREIEAIKPPLLILEQLYGATPAPHFGPNALRAVRAEMVRKGWSRKSINRQVSRVRALFRWGAAHEMLPESIYHQLRTMEPLRRGEAPERPKVRPVPRHLIRAIRHRLPLPVRALVDLQLLTAARADELVNLRAGDIDRSRPVWAYSPIEHKTAYRDKERRIFFGPKAQKILKLFLTPGRGPEDFLFSPRDAEQARHAQAKVHRRPGQKPNPLKTERTLGDHYSTVTYRRCIHRALAEAFPVPKKLIKPQERRAWRREHTWGPHRLRHNAATFLRREFGVEVAQAVCGHSSIMMTLLYAEQDEKRIVEAMRRVG